MNPVSCGLSAGLFGKGSERGRISGSVSSPIRGLVKITPLIVMLMAMSVAHGGNLVLESGPGGVGDVSWTGVDLHLQTRADQRITWQAEIRGLALPDADLELGYLEVRCDDGSLGPDWPRCTDGHLAWDWAEGPPVEGRFVLDAGPRLSLQLASPAMDIELALVDGDPRITAVMSDGDLGELAGPLAALLDLAYLDGTMNLDARYEAGRLHVDMRLDQVAFDNVDGSLAGDGVRLEAIAELIPGEDGLAFDLTLAQSAGDLLFGPAYLPAPARPVAFRASGGWQNGRLAISEWSIEDSRVLTASGDLVVDFSDDEPIIRSLEVADLDLHLPAAQERYLNGILAGWALDDLETGGRIRGQGSLRDGQLHDLVVELEDVLVHDPAGRLGIAGLSGSLVMDQAGGGDGNTSQDRLQASLDWDAAELYTLPLGPSVLRLETEGPDLRLTRPLFFPLLDGGFRIESLEWAGWRSEQPRLDVVARLEPLDFARLTVALGLPELGGTLSGAFPEIRYEEGVLSFGGGFDIQAFSGTIEVRDMSIERPFGTLPVVAADVGFDRLDLLEVTGAFDFGRMEGQLMGRVDHLRMLDWTPVAFDARLITREDVPRRRISQRAVGNLSSLGGGGAAALGPLLSIFEDFPYRRAGLTCVLSNNVCRMGGVATRPDGGYVILEGRALPRLDVVGHRKLVDWPLLMAQLQSITQAEIR